MLGGILGIALVIAAVLAMFGLIEPAKRIIVIILLLAVVVPALRPLMNEAAQYVNGWALGLLEFGLLSLICIAGWKRHVDHRRSLHHWRGDPPSSLKHRVEEDI